MKQKIKLMIVSIPLLASAFVNVYFAFILQRVIDSTSTGDTKELAETIVIALIYLIFDIVISLVAKYASSRYIMIELKKLKNKKVNSILRGNSGIIKPDFISTLTVDIEMIERDYYQQQIRIIFNAMQFAIGLIAIVYISFTLTIAIAAVTVLPLTIPALFRKRVEKNKDAFSSETRSYTEFLKEMETGMNVINDFSLDSRFITRHLHFNENVEKSRLKSRFIEETVDIISQNLGFLTFITALALGSYFVIIGKMTFGLMIASIQLMNNIVQPLNYISHSLNKTNSVKGILKEFDEEIKEPHKEQLIETIECIELKNVHYAYPNGEEVLKDYSVKFEKGKKYALVGESGCGKSTVLKLITGECKPDFGEVLINGKKVDSLDKKIYTGKLGIVRQKVFLFKDTLENNISLWNMFSRSRVEDAINSSELAGVIENENGGLNKLISDDEGLSGGQKQRIAIARALAKRADVFVMDEATSSLDDKTALRVMKNITSNHMSDKIGIFATHKQGYDMKEIFDEVIELSAV